MNKTLKITSQIVILVMFVIVEFASGKLMGNKSDGNWFAGSLLSFAGWFFATIATISIWRKQK